MSAKTSILISLDFFAGILSEILAKKSHRNFYRDSCRNSYSCNVGILPLICADIPDITHLEIPMGIRVEVTARISSDIEVLDSLEV